MSFNSKQKLQWNIEYFASWVFKLMYIEITTYILSVVTCRIVDYHQQRWIACTSFHNALDTSVCVRYCFSTFFSVLMKIHRWTTLMVLCIPRCQSGFEVEIYWLRSYWNDWLRPDCVSHDRKNHTPKYLALKLDQGSMPRLPLPQCGLAV